MKRESYQRYLDAIKIALSRIFEPLLPGEVKTAIVLSGTWTKILPSEKNRYFYPLRNLKGIFETVENLENQMRGFTLTEFSGRPVLVLHNPVQMNECTFNHEGLLAVRAQIEVLIALGVQNLILIEDVESLKDYLRVGQIAFVDGWISDRHELLPLFGEETRNPEDAIANQFYLKIRTNRQYQLLNEIGASIHWQGPHRPGKLHDIPTMRATRACCISSRLKVETSIAAQYTQVRILPLGLVYKDMNSHTTHLDQTRIQKLAPQLNDLLAHIVELTYS